MYIYITHIYNSFHIHEIRENKFMLQFNILLIYSYISFPLQKNKRKKFDPIDFI
jgi:hypothetical protein